jgi:mannose-1-phosphate guanylyltransferase
MSEASNWAAIMAGGDGRRLQAFTQLIAGDERPKQFCRLFGGNSLLHDTRARVCRNVEPWRTVYVVTRHHEPFYQHELADVPRAHVIAQPLNRGTAAAIIYALRRVSLLGQDPAIGFFPADHYYRDHERLRRAVDAAYAVAHAQPDRVVLLGARAERPETDYGWIEPGPSLEFWRAPAVARMMVRGVAGFVEKPSGRQAAQLWRKRCLWNTFVLIGKASAFQHLLESTVPQFLDAFDVLKQARTLADETRLARTVYESIPAIDFSRDVVAARPDLLAVVDLPMAGWTDLGEPSRVLTVMADRRRPGGHLHLAAS